MLSIKPVIDEGQQLNIVRGLFKAYQQELNEDLCFQSFETELQDPFVKYKSGAILLAYWDNEVAGCIALQELENGVCEMKRLYVKPSFRKHKIGEALSVKLIDLARQSGYTIMKLDTLQKLQPAIALYKKLGFEETTAYYTNPIKDVVYMQKTL
jgi:putative acetyltransferase